MNTAALKRPLRLLFAALLLTAAAAKLLDMPGFASVVDSYAAVPTIGLSAAAWALALSELALGAWLLSGMQTRRAAIALIALHLLYLIWIMLALVRDLAIPNCGCFGVYWPRPLTWVTPIEDLALLLLAGTLWLATADRQNPGR